MKRRAWWVSALMALLLACLPAVVAQSADVAGGKPKRARKKRERPQRKPKGPQGEYAIMAKVLNMDTDQQAKLMEIVEANGKAMKEWATGPSGQKLKELSEASREARKAKDREKMKQISQEMKPLAAERNKLQADRKASIMAILTDEQKAAWAGFVVYRNTMRRFKRCKLTEDQDKQVRDLCSAAAKTMPDSSDRKAYREAVNKLNGEVEEKVLTPEQREELKKRPEKKVREPREKKPRAKKGKKAGQPVIVE